MIRLLLLLLLLFTSCAIATAQVTAAIPVCNGTNDTTRVLAVVTNAALTGGTVKTPKKLAGQKCAVNTMTWPANVTLDDTEGTGIKVNTGQTLTIEGGNIVAPLTKQVFFNAVAGGGTVRFTGQYPAAVSPIWWGATANDGTDDLPAINAMLASLARVQSAPFYRTGANIVFPEGAYRSSGAIEVYGPHRIYGNGGMSQGDQQATSITFTTASHGFVFHSHNTSAVYSATSSQGAQLSGFKLVGTYAGGTGTADITGLTITRLSGPAYNADFASYYTITVGGYPYVVETVADANTLTLHKPRLLLQLTNGSVTATDGVGTIYGISWPTNAWAGQAIKIDGVSYTIASNTTNALTLTAPYAGTTGTVEAQVQSLDDDTDITTTLNKYHGVQAWAHVHLEHITVFGFSGNGFNFDTSTVPSATPAATDINANTSTVLNVSAQANRGSGILVRGLNSNAMSIVNFDGSANNGAGIMEVSFLGNNWVGGHTSYNSFGAFFSNQPACAFTSTGLYTEGGQPSAVNSQFGRFIGGTHGAGFAEPWNGYMTGSRSLGGYSGYNVSTPIHIIRGAGDADGTAPAVSTATLLGETTAFPTFLGIGAGNDTPSSTGTWSPTTPGFAYRLSYGLPGSVVAGYYSLGYDDPNVADIGKHLLAFSGSAAADGAKKLWLPNGIHFIGANKDVGLERASAITLKVTNGGVSHGNLEVAGLTTQSGSINATIGGTTPQGATFTTVGSSLYAVNNGPTLVEGLLQTTSGVNMNTATATTLYTCPGGKTCVITKVIVRNASTSLTTASYSFGWTNPTYTDTIANATHTELTGNTLYTMLLPKAGATLGTATGTFKVLMNTLQGGAATTTIDVFGYTF